MADEKLLKGVKSFLRSVLISAKDGVPAYNLQRDYKEMVGELVPFKKLGFPTLEDFIQSIPDVVELRWRQGVLFYCVVPDEATAHIHDLVSKQKSNRKLKKPVRRPRGGGGSRFLSRRQFSSAERGPKARSPVFNRTLLPSPMGVPAFRAPAPTSPKTSPPTPITVKVGNSATGSRTVRMGSKTGAVKVNRLFYQAMSAVSSERSETKSASQYEVPPRFKKQKESMKELSQPQPTRKPSGPKVTFPTVENGEKFMKILTKYCQETNQGLKFETFPTKVGPATGYVSSIKLKNVLYGSEDVFKTAKEAEEACAMMAVGRLGLLDVKTGPKEGSKTEAKQTVTTYPPEQLRIVRSRVKEILSNKRNGLWGTRIPFEYKERYKDEPPPDLLNMIKQWTDIAKVEWVEATGIDIVYPVLEDVSENKKRETKTAVETTDKKEPIIKTAVEKIDEKEAKSKERIDKAVKDLIDLHKDTVKKQTEVLKTLVIPREDLLNLDEEVIVYMTYIYNPGYFCVQREDSSIEEMSEELQKFCQSKLPPSFDELQKGQFCAGIYSGDNSWTRAEILQVKRSPPSVELLFVDFGNVETTSPESVRWLSPDTAKVPIQAANCSLYGIEPIEMEDEWSKKASKEFAELVQEEALIAIPKQIYDDSIYDIELYLKSDPSVSINQKLVELGVVRTVAKPIIEEDELNEPPQLVLPEGNQWDVYITYITSTNSVMLRLVGEEYSDKLDAFAGKLEEAFKNTPEETPIVMGNLYIAYDDELYHRVRALSQEGKKVTCYFPDHGDTDWQIPDQLRPLDPEVNKFLPYQAIEVSLYGLEEVATNVTALSKLCDLALANTCVAEVVERDEIPSVILYDTSQDEDVNINEAILQAVKEDGGGIDTPRTLSPALGSNPPTPQQALSPVQSSADVRGKTGSSQDLKSSDRLNTQVSDTVKRKSNEKLGSSQNLPSEPQVLEKLGKQDNSVVEKDTNVELSNLKAVNHSDEKLKTTKTEVNGSQDKLPKEDEIKIVPRFTESWTNPTQSNDKQIDLKQIDYNSNISQSVSDKDTIQVTLNENLTNTFENLALSNQDEVPSSANQYRPSDQVTDSKPIREVTNKQPKKQWSLDGRTIWNRTEYFKRPLPPNFEMPPVGDYVDIHVNFIHDPSNFVCIPYALMNDLNQLFLDMIEYFSPPPSPMLKKDDIKLDHLYAGHKDGVWYRIKAKQFVSDDLLSVYLVDIGEYSVLMIEEIQPLPWTFWKLPLQAINAKLSSVQPISGTWSEAAKYKFIDLAREKDLIGLILDQDSESGVVSLSLIDTSDSAVDLCIDECLVKLNYASYC